MKKISGVFWISIIISALFVFWGAVWPERLIQIMNQLQVFFLVRFGWFYQLTASFFSFLGGVFNL